MRIGCHEVGWRGVFEEMNRGSDRAERFIDRARGAGRGLRRGLVAGRVVAIVIGLAVVLGCAGTVALWLVAGPQPDHRAARAIGALRRIEAQREAMREDFAAAHRAGQVDRMPTFTLDGLIDKGRMTQEQLESPFGPAPDGEGDYWVHPALELEDGYLPENMIAAYDRAMAARENRVAVAFFDGRVEVKSIHEFERLAAQPPHDGFDLHLPPRVGR